MISSVEPLQAKDVRQFYQTWYGSQGAILALSGAVSAKETLRPTRRNLARFFSGQRHRPQLSPAPAPKCAFVSANSFARQRDNSQVYFWGHLGVERRPANNIAALRFLRLGPRDALVCLALASAIAQSERGTLQCWGFNHGQRSSIQASLWPGWKPVQRGGPASKPCAKRSKNC